MTVLSNTDALLVAVPMIGLLVICHFRLDELVGKPRKRNVSCRGFVGIGSGCEKSLDPRQGRESGERGTLQRVRGPRVRAEVD